MPQKYFIKTFGCTMNHSDSERLAAILEKKSPPSSPFYKGGEFKRTSDINEANLVVFNTCGVRQMAEDRVYGQIHNLKRQATCDKRHVTIILTGCLANRKDVQRRLKNKVDLFCEIRNFSKEFEKLNNKLQTLPTGRQVTNRKQIPNTKYQIPNTSKEDIAYLSINPKHTKAYQAYIPIMTGCNNFCAYCVVPHARGREVSRPPAEIIREIKSLVKKGCKHIILLGQNVNSYISPSPLGRGWRKAPGEGINFSKLLKKINALPGKFWISFMSNHPKDVTDEMIETVAKCQKVCECFHLPIQSGNDKIIHKMNRKYTAQEYLKLVNKIKKAYAKYKPAVPYAVTSDIIVGFPGETKKQFLDSAKIMQQAKYDMVFFGQYSPRPNTAAWHMKDNISKNEKVRRENYLNEILKKTSFANNKKYVGKILEVLIEKSTFANSRLPRSNPPRIYSWGELETVENKEIIYFGKTRTMKNVKIMSSKKDLVEKIMRVEIIKANVWNLEGKMQNKKADQ